MLRSLPMLWLQNALYPPLCLDCGKCVENRQEVFCKDCVTLLEYIDPRGRCPFCFHTSANGALCQTCRKGRNTRYRKAACFEEIGPAHTLRSALTHGNLPHLAQGASAYMTLQLLKLRWPLPDLVIPTPIPFPNRWERGYNQNALLAEGIASQIKRPFLDCLVVSLSKDCLESYRLKKSAHLEDKTLLLVTDQFTESPQLTLCNEALQEGCPRRIYSLALSSTIQ